MIRCSADTWVDSEEVCSDIGQFRRKFRAIHQDTRCVVRGKAAVADTFFSIPATTVKEHGFLTNENGVLVFVPHTDQSQTPADYRKECRQQCK